VPGYQLTMTDSSAATVDVDGFAVVFYDPAGTELGSDKENVTEQFITAGQSQTWTEYSPTDAAGGSHDFGDATVPAGAATCQLVTWYHP
jgi:hypothetical protein